MQKVQRRSIKKKKKDVRIRKDSGKFIEGEELKDHCLISVFVFVFASAERMVDTVWDLWSRAKVWSSHCE